MVTYAKNLTKKIVNLRDIAGNAEEKEENEVQSVHTLSQF